MGEEKGRMRTPCVNCNGPIPDKDEPHLLPGGGRTCRLICRLEALGKMAERTAILEEENAELKATLRLEKARLEKGIAQLEDFQRSVHAALNSGEGSC